MTRLPFNFVEYDGHPEREIEPINHVPYALTHDLSNPTNNYIPVNPMVHGAAVIASIEVFDSPPLAEVMEFHFI
jgi:hypothetical protein